MSGLGREKQRWVAASLAGVLLASALSGCEYTDGVDPAQGEPDQGGATPREAAAARSYPPRKPVPTKRPELLALEARNTAGLELLLGPRPENALVYDIGVVGAGARGFARNARVISGGSYLLTVACLGAPDAQVHLMQDPLTGVEPYEVSFECGAATTRTVYLEPGGLSASALRFSAGSELGSGAVAGIRITANPG